MNQYIKLHANCIIVSGIKQSILCDLQRGEIFSIPEGIVEIFTTYSALPVDTIYEKYDSQLQDRIKGFFDYLIEQDLAFYTSSPQNFPALDLSWKHPSKITNAILDFDENSAHKIEAFVQKLADWGCKGIEVRYFCSITEEELNKIASIFDSTRIRDIKIFFAYQEAIHHWDFDRIFISHQRISSILVHSAPKTEQIYKSVHFSDVGVYLLSNTINNATHCGAIDTGFFAINLDVFTEAQEHNTCLNRKIAVDVNGHIKNCPSMSKSFGHVEHTNLDPLISSPEFTKLWKIKKDDIDKCKTCEFRYICTDCRAYLEKPDNIYSAPLKCGYDPNTGIWEDWSQNPLKQQAIKDYHFSSLIHKAKAQ